MITHVLHSRWPVHVMLVDVQVLVLLPHRSPLLWPWPRAHTPVRTLPSVPARDVQQCNRQQPTVLSMPTGPDHSRNWQQILHRLQG